MACVLPTGWAGAGLPSLAGESPGSSGSSFPSRLLHPKAGEERSQVEEESEDLMKLRDGLQPGSSQGLYVGSEQVEPGRP